MRELLVDVSLEIQELREAHLARIPHLRRAARVSAEQGGYPELTDEQVLRLFAPDTSKLERLRESCLRYLITNPTV